MVDPAAMTVVYSVQELEKGMLGPEVISNIVTTFRDVVKEITLRAVLQNDKDTVKFFDNLVHSHHIGVGGSVPMQTDLPGLERDLALVQRASVSVELTQRLDGIASVVENVHGRVDNAICACSQDAVEAKSPCENLAQPGLWRNGSSASNYWRCDWR